VHSHLRRSGQTCDGHRRVLHALYGVAPCADAGGDSVVPCVMLQDDAHTVWLTQVGLNQPNGGGGLGLGAT